MTVKNLLLLLFFWGGGEGVGEGWGGLGGGEGVGRGGGSLVLCLTPSFFVKVVNHSNNC